MKKTIIITILLILPLIYAGVPTLPYDGTQVGMTHLWHLDGNSFADSVGGVTLTDGGVANATGYFSDGQYSSTWSNNLDIPHTPSHFNNPMTLEYWLKTPSSYGTTMFQSFYSGGLQFHHQWVPNGTIHVYIYDGANHWTGTKALSTNTWYHVAWTLNGTTYAIYIDGEFQGNITMLGNYFPVCTRAVDCNILGSENYQQAGEIGTIDEIALYNITKTDFTYPLPLATDIFVVNNTLNFTSDGGQICGFTGSEYVICGPTYDPTPSFRFDTLGISECKLTNLTDRWDCGTTNDTTHICTIGDELARDTLNLYINCTSGSYTMTNFVDANTFNISILGLPNIRRVFEVWNVSNNETLFQVNSSGDIGLKYGGIIFGLGGWIKQLVGGWLGINKLNVTEEFILGTSVQDDLRFSASSIKITGVVGQPQWEQTGYGIGYGLAFDDTTVESAYVNIQLPHTMAFGTHIYPHFHWSSGANATGQVVWCFEYAMANINNNFDSGNTQCVTDYVNYNPYIHLITPEIDIDTSNLTASAMLNGRIFRNSTDPNDNLSNGADAILWEFDVHVYHNKLGSDP